MLSAFLVSLLSKEANTQAPNLACFIERVASHPERLQYIYFNTVLLLRAVSRLGPYLSAYDYCSTGNHEDDQETLARISKLVHIAQNVGKFDETVLFRGENANVRPISQCVDWSTDSPIGVKRRVQNSL